MNGILTKIKGDLKTQKGSLQDLELLSQLISNSADE
jgi:hypothetical protein